MNEWMNEKVSKTKYSALLSIITCLFIISRDSCAIWSWRSCSASLARSLPALNPSRTLLRAYSLIMIIEKILIRLWKKSGYRNTNSNLNWWEWEWYENGSDRRLSQWDYHQLRNARYLLLFPSHDSIEKEHSMNS